MVRKYKLQDGMNWAYIVRVTSEQVWISLNNVSTPKAYKLYSTTNEREYVNYKGERIYLDLAQIEMDKIKVWDIA